MILRSFLALLLLATAGCRHTSGYGRPGEPLARRGDEIMVAGQLLHTGAPVVLWTDPGGYDAYRVECHFDPSAMLPSSATNPTPNRYGTRRQHLPVEMEQRVREHGWDIETLREQIDLFVLHYDAAGTSRQCFKVLHDVRGLSVHFMLDLDGTIYQTLDVKERAWHAGSANDRSVGVEIANIGAYGDEATLDQWYSSDASGRVRVTLPAKFGDGGLRTPGFVARPAREQPVTGRINGTEVLQYDFTSEQYHSLVCLAATLCQVLPRIHPDAPRDEQGRVYPAALLDDQLRNTVGIVGHYHLTTNKLDPGPAFDWERFFTELKRNLPARVYESR